MPGDGNGHNAFPPRLPDGSRLSVIRGGDDSSKSITIELPAAGRRMMKRASICFLIIALMSSIPVIGLWYILIYKNMIPGPAGDIPVAHPQATGGSAPAWYPWMVIVSLSFISAIFLFAAFTFLIEALHILFGRTRLTISPEGIGVERLISDRHIRFGERFIEKEDITDVSFREDEKRIAGSLRITVIHHPVDLAEEVGDADRRWIADVVEVMLSRQGAGHEPGLS